MMKPADLIRKTNQTTPRDECVSVPFHKPFDYTAKPIDRVIARPRCGRGNLKVEGMASRGEAGKHEARRNPHNGNRKTGNTAQSAFSASFSDFGSFRFTVPRSGMPFRFV